MKWFLVVVVTFVHTGLVLNAEALKDDHVTRHPGFLTEHQSPKRPSVPHAGSKVIPLQTQRGTALRQEGGKYYSPTIRVVSETQLENGREVTIEVNHENPCAKDRVTPYVKRRGSIYSVEIQNEKLPTEIKRCIGPLYPQSYTFTVTAKKEDSVVFQNPRQ